MTSDVQLISHVLRIIDPKAENTYAIKRNRRTLLGIPPNTESAGRAVRLYQPQRWLARLLVTGIGWMIRLNLHHRTLPKIRVTGESVALTPPLDDIDTGTCGVMLGSPEHVVRRAITSYRKDGRWEVAKVAFGIDGAALLKKEAMALEELQDGVAGVPSMLGLHQGHDVTLLRMPYLTGNPVAEGDFDQAIQLLNSWISDDPSKPTQEFPEWPDMWSALSVSGGGSYALERLAAESLRPVICHGDFARWNLLRGKDGNLLVLDWEWGHSGGLPGIDLVHFVLQDARLVKRMKPVDAILKTLEILSKPPFENYLRKTGWSSDPILPIQACLAYKQGAGHQENSDILKVALDLTR